jgi:hypothetical protein
MGHPDNGTQGALVRLLVKPATQNQKEAIEQPLSTKFPAFNPPNWRIGVLHHALASAFDKLHVRDSQLSCGNGLQVLAIFNIT